MATLAVSTSSPASALASTATNPMHSCNGSYQARISALASAIQPRVLASTSGSGNHGESGIASWYTIDKLPMDLSKPSPSTTATSSPLEKVDIDLGPGRIAFVIDNVLTHDEADQLAACAEAVLEHNGHSRMAPGIRTPPGMRINEAAHWYPSHAEAQPQFLGPLLQRIRHLVPETLEENGLPLYPKISEKIAQFKYTTGDRFNRHVDGLFPGQGANPQGDGVDEWRGIVSGFSMLFYLNDGPTDGLEGGETRLWSADGSRSVDVTPLKGRVLVFRRGSYSAVMHAGLPVTGPVPKYMALINLAYGTLAGTTPMMR